MRCRRIIAADLSTDVLQSLSHYRPDRTFFPVTSIEEAQVVLKGWTKGPSEKMEWGSNNLGVGLLLAHRSRKCLQTTDGASPTITYISNGEPLLIVCEAGNELAQVISSNLAFAIGAAFLVIPELTKGELYEWQEEIYALGLAGNVSERFASICNRARCRLPDIKFDIYKQLVFVTSGFPWGIGRLTATFKQC